MTAQVCLECGHGFRAFRTDAGVCPDCWAAYQGQGHSHDAAAASRDAELVRELVA